jgi:hypothetical protein
MPYGRLVFTYSPRAGSDQAFFKARRRSPKKSPPLASAFLGEKIENQAVMSRRAVII